MRTTSSAPETIERMEGKTHGASARQRNVVEYTCAERWQAVAHKGQLVIPGEKIGTDELLFCFPIDNQ